MNTFQTKFLFSAAYALSALCLAKGDPSELIPFWQAETIGSFISTGDFDGDRRADIALSSPELDHVTFLMTPRFNPARARIYELPLQDLRIEQPVVVDWDGDGDPDILATTSKPRRILLLENRWIFEQRFFVSTLYSDPHEDRFGFRLNVGHVNSDDLPDIVIGSSKPTLTILEQRADGTCNSIDVDSRSPFSFFGAYVEVFQISPDALPQVLCANQAGEVASFRRIGKSNEWREVKVLEKSGSVEALRLLHLDSDEHLDMLTAAWGPGPIRKWTIKAKLTEEPSALDPVTIHQTRGAHLLNVLDVDGDGDLDILPLEPISPPYWLEQPNVLDEPWKAHSISIRGSNLEQEISLVLSAVVDLNGDSREEVLVSTAGSKTIFLWRPHPGWR